MGGGPRRTRGAERSHLRSLPTGSDVTVGRHGTRVRRASTLTKPSTKGSPHPWGRGVSTPFVGDECGHSVLMDVRSPR